MGDIIFLHGSYHGPWCWSEEFLLPFRQAGYRTHCPDLREERRKTEAKGAVSPYVEALQRIVLTMETKPVLVVHSMYSIVALEYLKSYAGSLRKLIFLAPIPFVHPFFHTLRSGIRQIRHSKKTLFFSDRISDEEADTYLDCLCKEDGALCFQASMPHWKKKEAFPVPACIIASENDKCLGSRGAEQSGKVFGISTTILPDVCHNMMLDPDHATVSRIMMDFMEEENEE